MRTFSLLFLTLTFGSVLGVGQDPGQMAAQQAAQQATQLSIQISTQNAQMASEQAMRDAQQANQNARAAQQAAQQQAMRNTRAGLLPPSFSMKTGAYSSPITVEIKDATRGAAIYYTTDNWTPTANSLPYTGPITIDATTPLQAIAILPNGAHSRVTSSLYTLPGKPTTKSEPNASSAVPASDSENLLLAKGTAVPLAFASDVSSKNLDVGDKISLTLAEDLKAGDVVVVKKGTPAFAQVTGIDKAHFMGVPAELYFQVDSLLAGGNLIKLKGSAAKQGHDREATAAALMFPAPIGVFVHGKDAEIKQGAVFTAHVSVDAVLPPTN